MLHFGSCMKFVSDIYAGRKGDEQKECKLAIGKLEC